MEKLLSIPINELPLSFRKEIHDHQRNFSVTMLIHDDGVPHVIPCSGSLVQIGDHKGIVTARHVWDEAKNHQFLLILVGRGNYVFEIVHLVPAIPDPVKVIREYGDARVPDIAFLKISEKHANDLETKGKVFLNIDKRTKNSTYLPDLGRGYWTIFGNPYEWLKTDEKIVSSFVYGTEISTCFENNGWDYFVMSMDTPTNPDIPREFSGMSGGGIWWTPWGCDEMKKSFWFEAPSLVGVSFFQTELSDRMIIGHGPKSIYNLLYKHVLRTL